MNSEEENALLAMELASSSILPMVIKATIELGVFDILSSSAVAGASLSGADIAAHLPATNPNAGEMIDRMLRLLACHSVVTCYLRRTGAGDSLTRLYGLTPVSKLLTKNDDGVSFAHLCLMNSDEAYMASWHQLKTAVLDGGVPFEKAHGMNVFEYRKRNQGFSKIFNRAMFDNSTITMRKLVETYEGFEGVESVVDVGGGSGALLGMIMAKYPSIATAINFDLPHVLQQAPSLPGVEHVAGDMFESVPRGDAILMKAILHNWSDEKCVAVLKKCHDAVAEKGKVVVIESVISESAETSLVARRVVRVDVVMLAHNPGGKERTEKEYAALAKAAGFRRCRLVCDAFYTHVLELHKT